MEKEIQVKNEYSFMTTTSFAVQEASAKLIGE